MALNETLCFDGMELKLTNLDKIYFPEDGFRKSDVLNYYQFTSTYLLPHILGRPLVLVRYPDGIHGKYFYQKQCPVHAPKQMPTVKIPSSVRGSIRYCLAENLAHLLWVINTGSIEVHTWLSKQPLLDNPTDIAFDLDPPDESSFDLALEVAILLKTALDAVGMQAYVKTTGATGLHVFVPIEANYKYEQVREVAVFLARHIEAIHPQVTLERTVKKRGSKLYLDCWQIARGKTLASVFSIRPRQGAPVSMPLSWQEVSDGKLEPNNFNIRTAITEIPDRIHLWPTFPIKQSLQDIQSLMYGQKTKPSVRD